MDTNSRSRESAAKPYLMYGWLAKGLLFVLIGGLAVELARRGYSSEDADQTGALQALARAPAGQVLVIVVSAGLLLYSAWQIWTAIVRDAGDGSELESIFNIVRRIGWFFLGLVYGLIALTGLEIAMLGDSGSGSGSGSSSTGASGSANPEELTERLFHVPGGRLIVVVIGVGTAVVGAYHLWKGLRQDYLGDIDTSGLSTAYCRFLQIAGTAGFAARALLLFVTGWLFISAALDFDPTRAAGIDDALNSMAEAPAGTAVLLVCGLGLIAAGGYDMVTFRRQRIHEM